MEQLKINKITLDTDGVLRLETNIKDNLELAKYVDKDKIEKSLNPHFLEMHIYQSDNMISSVMYEGQSLLFHYKEFIEFLEEKRNNKK
jgi:hypothetical protein